MKKVKIVDVSLEIIEQGFKTKMYRITGKC